ncbi:MAG: DUF4446 family protein [Jatrophihabitantaceae bacterium]
MTSYVAVFAMALGYVALVAAYCALRTLAKLRRATSVLARGSRGTAGKESLIEATERHAAQTAALGEQLAELRSYVDATCAQTVAAVQEDRAEVSAALRNVALVRYDAFADTSGRMSFSLALLDERGNGVTITAITGRTDTRVYAKGVAGGRGEHELSPEEGQAVAAALHTPRTGLLKRKAS